MSQQKAVLITGASKGIGFATAQYLQGLGYQVIGIARQKSLIFLGIYVALI